VGLREWAERQVLPVIAVGDFNFDYEVPAGPGNAAFASFTLDQAFKWVKPADLLTTNWSDRNQDNINDFNSILDFAFVSGAARLWNASSQIVVRDGDFPDNASTSDHRPILLWVDPDEVSEPRGPVLRLAGSQAPPTDEILFGSRGSDTPASRAYALPDSTPVSSRFGSCIQAYPDFIEIQLDKRDQALAQLLETDAPVYEYVISNRRWLPGAKITVAFQGGTYQLQRQIAAVAATWQEHGNFEFDFGFDETNRTIRQWSDQDTDYAADIRVSFNFRGNWSLVGTDSTNPAVVAPGQPSLNLGGFHRFPPADWRATVLHEFGHALGFQHEHQSQLVACDFRFEDDPGYSPTTDTNGQFIVDSSGRRPGLYTTLGGPPNNWVREKVDHNLRQLTEPSSAFLLGTSFDAQSIMKYFFDADMFVGGQDSDCFTSMRNLALSAGDIEGVSRAYPEFEPIDALDERMSIAANLTSVQVAVEDPYQWQAYRSAYEALVPSSFKSTFTVKETHLVPVFETGIDSPVLFGSNPNAPPETERAVSLRLPVAKSAEPNLGELFERAAEVMPGARKDAVLDFVKQTLGLDQLNSKQLEQLEQELQWFSRSTDFLEPRSWVRLDASSLNLTGFGRFDGQVEATWLDDRNMRLNRDFAYIDSNGKRWTATAGSIVNGASIPRAFWTLIGAPFSGAYRNASVVHDVYCENRRESWRDVHRMFYHACRAGGVSMPQAKVMYYAVYHFGPRWNAPSSAFEAGFSLPTANTPKDLLPRISEFVELNDPSLEEIEAFSIDRLPNS
jgi:hypothetical protein